VSGYVFRNEPFDENVEGLSHGGNEGYVFEAAVQEHDFEDSRIRRFAA
jgi:hypothetical protein